MAVKENEMIADTTMLILSCDKYSDLWDGQVKLLKQNWPDCNYTILIVTDKESSLNYDNVKIFPTGQDLEWSQRLAMVLSSIDTKYVFITLDDYYLINKVDNNKITEIYKMMESYSLDYVRLFSRPTKATLNKIED